MIEEVMVEAAEDMGEEEEVVEDMEEAEMVEDMEEAEMVEDMEEEVVVEEEDQVEANTLMLHHLYKLVTLCSKMET